jgi:hypothetical protein
VSDETDIPRGSAEPTPPSTESPEPGGTVTAVAVMNEGVPPAGEDIHLPPGTAIPLVLTLGVTLTLVGTTIWWGWTIMGVIIFGGALGMWIRDTRREVAHLPDEHGSPAHH